MSEHRKMMLRCQERKYLNGNRSRVQRFSVQRFTVQSSTVKVVKVFDFGSYLRFGYCNLEFICNLVLVICCFWFIRVRGL